MAKLGEAVMVRLGCGAAGLVWLGLVAKVRFCMERPVWSSKVWLGAGRHGKVA